MELIPFLTSHNFKTYAASSTQYVYDNADLLNEDEEKDIQDMCYTYGESNNTHIFILTVQSTNGLTRKLYIEKFYDQFVSKLKKYNGNAAIMLIEMDSAHRGFQIQGYGDEEYSAQYYLTNSRIQSVIKEIKPLLTIGDYHAAMKEYIHQVDHYVGLKSIYHQIWFQLLIAMAIGGISVAIMAYNSGGRVTVGDATYLDQSNSRILAKRDDYIRTTYTRVQKPKNNDNNSGGSSSGTSPGGNSHSGGDSSF
jgi:uncharacterized protein